MAFVSRIGNLLKQAGSKHAYTGLSASNSLLFQTARSMSSAKLFVGGLSYSTDENSLRQAFGQYGQVIEAKVVMDRETGRSRGFGFISFTSSEEANNALRDMDGKELHGRMVRVNFATEKPRPAFNNYGGGGGNYGSGGGSYGSGGGGYGSSGGGYGDGSNSYGRGNYGGGGYGDGGNNSGNFNSPSPVDEFSSGRVGDTGSLYGSGGGGGSYGDGGNNSGNFNSPPSVEEFSSDRVVDTGSLFGGGAEQKPVGGFQGTDGGNEDFVEGKFGDDSEEPDDGYANNRN